jgi:hypothetical protein
MAFIALFAIGVFIIALLGEIHQKGKDNILTRSGQEIATTAAYARVSAKIDNIWRILNGFAVGMNELAGLVSTKIDTFGRKLREIAGGMIVLAGLAAVAVLMWYFIKFVLWLFS